MTHDDTPTGRLPLVEDFYTLQGEGRNTGRAVYFIRLAGCDVGCRWCDAAYTWNRAAHPMADITDIVARAASHPARVAVITGGEPLMHDLSALTAVLKEAGFEVCIETSGTHPLSGHIDWVCLSPKRQRPPLQSALDAADELKVIIETAEDFAWAESNAAKVRPGCLLYLQPEWESHGGAAAIAVEYVKAHPEWRISLQTHKYLDIP